MNTRDNGFGGGAGEYETGPFRIEALSEDAVLREPPRITPFGDLETPFARTPEREDEDEDQEDSEREDHENVCPHCGRELEQELDEAPMMGSRSFDEAPDDHETPFLGEDAEEESPFETAEVFDELEGYGDAEWEEQEVEEVDHLFEAEAEFASLSPTELKAVRITSTFETGHAGGFGGLTANIDGQGLSFGLMNWTIKAGSLIPMLQEFITKHADRYARIFGSDADRFKAMVFATRRDPDSGRQVRDVSAQMDFVRGKMNDASQKHIVEPWQSYFGGLENDPEFRAIEVAAARRGLAHAKRWFDRFGWKSERGFAFMFDLVAQAGPWWLDAKKFHGHREKLLAERTAQKKAELGRDLNELEMMELLANLIADVSLKTWREQVRVRKLWFVHGSGTVHGKHYDLARDFGVTDRAADFSSSTASAPPSRDESSMFDVFGDAAKRIGQVVTGLDERADVRFAISNGETDPAKLTNLVFFTRHPELKGRKIKAGEQALADEWHEILRTIVRPALAKAPSSSTTPTPSPSVSSGVEVLGIDTSVSPGKKPKFTHDWAKAKADAGIAFAIPRAHTGWTSDPAFAKDWPELKAQGLVRGGYLFLVFPHPKHKATPPTPETQAKRFIKALDAVGGLDEGDFPPVLDVEFPGITKNGKTVMGGLQATGMTRKQLLAGVREAWQVLKDHYKVAPMIYTSYQVWLDDMPALKDDPAQDLTESPLWITPYYVRERKPPILDPAKVARLKFPNRGWYPAAWKKGTHHDPPVPPPWGDVNNWWIHQYQGDAIGFPGFTGDVDMNRFHTMMPGETGDRVKWVQRKLGVSVTGSFDATMEKALKSFQTKKGLTADAVIGPDTFARLCWA